MEKKTNFLQMYCKIGVLDIVQIYLNAPVLESLFNIVAGLHSETLLKVFFCRDFTH